MKMRLYLLLLNECINFEVRIGARHVILLFSTDYQVSLKLFLKALVKILKEP